MCGSTSEHGDFKPDRLFKYDFLSVICIVFVLA